MRDGVRLNGRKRKAGFNAVLRSTNNNVSDKCTLEPDNEDRSVRTGPHNDNDDHPDNLLIVLD